jgi:hypothetical protein
MAERTFDPILVKVVKHELAAVLERARASLAHL